jgi:hypothetical protein
LLATIVESDARHEIGESFGWGHSKMQINDRHVGVIKLGHEEREIESARTYYVAYGVKTRRYLVTFPSGNYGLRFADSCTQFGLSESGSQPSFLNQAPTHHAAIIVHICYNMTSKILQLHLVPTAVVRVQAAAYFQFGISATWFPFAVANGAP